MAQPKKRSPAEHLKPHWFEKGKSGNPKGRPPITAEQREFRKLTIEKYREIIEIALTGNIAQLKEYIEDPDTPAIQVGVATTLLKGIKNGDVSVLEHFAARLVGKIPDKIEINSNVNMNANVNERIAVCTDDEIKRRLKRIRSGV